MSKRKNRRGKRSSGNTEEQRNAMFRVALVAIGLIMGLVAAVTCMTSSL